MHVMIGRVMNENMGIKIARPPQKYEMKMPESSPNFMATNTDMVCKNTSTKIVKLINNVPRKDWTC